MPAGPPPAMQQRVESVSSILFVSQPSTVELVALNTLIFDLYRSRLNGASNSMIGLRAHAG